MSNVKWFYIILLLLFCSPVRGEGLEASFNGSRFTGLTRSTTIFESDGRTDENGDLVDISGENQFEYSEDYSQPQWGGSNVTMAPNVIKAPNRTLTANSFVADSGSVAANFSNGVIYTGDVGKATIWAKSGNKNWFYINNGNIASSRAWFNTTTCTTGTTQANVVDAEIVGPISGWCKCTILLPDTNGGIKFYVADADNTTTVTGDGSTVNMYFWGAHGRVGGRPNPLPNENFYVKSDAGAKKRLTMADQGTPVADKSTYQNLQGNNFNSISYSNAGTKFDVGKEDVMDMFENSNTITIVLKGNSTGAGADYIFYHLGSGGFLVRTIATEIQTRIYNGAGGYVTVINTMARDDIWHVYQLVRTGNTSIGYLDGVASTPVDVTGYMLDATGVLSVSDDSATFDGSIQYIRVDREALSTDRLNFERDVINGVAAGTGFIDPSWTFTRSTIAKKDCSQLGPRDVAINVPRVTKGVLIEAQGNNIGYYSEDIQGEWNSVRGTPLDNQIIAPDGTLTGASFAEDGTAASSHYYQLTGANRPSVTAGVTYTWTMWIQGVDGIGRGWIRPAVGQTGADAQANFDIINGKVGTTQAGAGGAPFIASIKGYPDNWFRWRMTWTASATELVEMSILMGDGDDSISYNGVLDQVHSYMWGSDIKIGAYPTSYVKTPSNGIVTRTADTIYIENHESGTNKIILPDTYDDSGELTIEFEMKALFADASQMTTYRYPLDISTDGAASADRLYIQITSAGELSVYIRDSDDDDHIMESNADPVDFSVWHTYKFYVNFGDLSTSDMWIDGVSVDDNLSSMTGSCDMDFTDAKIRLGHGVWTSEHLNGRIDELRIEPNSF